MIGCSACKAKDGEITWLRDELSRYRELLVNMADPLVQARLAALKSVPPMPAATGEVQPKRTTGRNPNDWRFRKDYPPASNVTRPGLTMDQIEAEIAKGDKETA